MQERFLRRSIITSVVSEKGTSLALAGGRVYLVGAGPGDPKLLTLRGKECLEEADVVIYDYLANPAILRHATKEFVELIYVGRRGRGHYLKQAEIYV